MSAGQRRRTPVRRGAAPWRLVAGGAAVVAALALLPLFAIDLPGVLPGPTYTPGSLQLLALCFAMAAAALSYHLLLGAAGLLSFGHALSFGAGVYGLAVILGHLGLPLVPAALLALVLAIALALAVGSISLRVGGIPFAMVTLAFAQAGSVLVRRNPGGATGGDEGLGLSTEHLPDALVGVVNTRNLYWLALAALVAVYAVVLWIQSSRAGHVAEAVRENELRARVLGLAPFAPKLIVFTVGGTLAAVAGMVFLLLQSGAVPSSVSSDFTITLLVMVVLGGVGSRWGAVVGGVLYTLLDQRLAALAGSAAVKDLPPVLRIPLSEPLFILGTLFILVVVFLPGGLAGAAARLRSRRRGAARAPEPEERLERVLEDA
ncbi:branched-chain amino acid ABC transporter permease [Sinomonas sp. RB5]